MRVEDGQDLVLLLLWQSTEQALEIRSQRSCSFLCHGQVVGAEIISRIALELFRSPLCPVKIPSRKLLVVLTALVHEHVTGSLMLAKKLYKVPNGRYDRFASLINLDPSKFDEIFEEVFEVGQG